MTPTSPDGSIMSKFAINKSWPNGIPEPILQGMKNKPVALPLSHMCNMSFQEGWCLNFLKIS